MESRFKAFLGNTPIIGMIHLAGDTEDERIIRALEEIALYDDERVSGVLIENYYHKSTVDELEEVLKQGSPMVKRTQIGLNVLPNEFQKAFQLAEKYKASFIQLDYVAGIYSNGDIELDRSAYLALRNKNQGVVVLGGVWPKYYNPVQDSNLKTDLRDARQRADAVVVTGTATGSETPLSKIQGFRDLLGSFPLVVGAGLNSINAYEQLKIADGAIVGSYFKSGPNSANHVDRKKVREIMNIAEDVRRMKEKLPQLSSS